jgi:hypothetical protein
MEPVNTESVADTAVSPDETPQDLQADLQIDLAETRERLGITDPDTSPENKEVLAGASELEYLRHVIHEQTQAKLEALQAADELQQQLLAAQSEAAKARTQYHGIPKSRGALTRAESDLAEANTRLHAAKKELDWERRTRRTEAIQAEAKIRRLEKELAEAKEATSQSPSRARRVYLRAAAGMALATLMTAGIVAFAVHRPNTVSASTGANATSEAPAANDQVDDLAAWQAKSAIVRHGAPASPDFTQSVDRLSQAFAALHGRDPDEILRQLQQAGKGCALRWNRGEPSLLFGNAGSKSATLSDAMNQCAEAVEKLK